MRIAHTDIVIAGGGIAGLSLGLALAQGGLKVSVVEALQREQMTAAAFDGRVSALAFAAVRMYRVLGVWDALQNDAQQINDIVVSDAADSGKRSPFSLHFDHREIGEPLGQIVENRHIRQALFERAAKERNLTIHFGATVRGLKTDVGNITALLSDGSEMRARLAVGADGRDSPLREDQGIRSVVGDYPQSGIVATVEHEKPHKGVAYEHFLPAGPFAILPMTGNRSSLVWTEPNQKVRALIALNEVDFTAEIAQRFGGHLGKVAPVAGRWCYPLRLHLSRAYVAPRFALVGDAVHTIHPLAGQGLNLGLKDVAALSETVLDAARLGVDFGALDVLRRYERWRRFDSFILAAVTDGLNRLFASTFPPFRLGRDLGMGVVDRIAPLRRVLMRHAGGDFGNLPRLLRGEAV